MAAPIKSAGADTNATIDISSEYTASTYTKNVVLIVGSGLQLDPNNITYNVSVNVDSFAPDYSVNLYKIVDGEKVYIDGLNSSSNGFVNKCAVKNHPKKE